MDVNLAGSLCTHLRVPPGVKWAAVCHAKLLHGHVEQFPPIRAENVFNDIPMCA